MLLSEGLTLAQLAPRHWCVGGDGDVGGGDGNGNGGGARPPRSRKLTITEILDSSSSDDDDNSLEMSGLLHGDNEGLEDVDEAIKEMDGMVQEWKVQLELVVGDTLKLLRRKTKDKRKQLTAMKGKNQQVKTAMSAAAREWRSELACNLSAMVKNINKVNQDSIERADTLERRVAGGRKDLSRCNSSVSPASSPPPPPQSNKKTIVNLEFDAAVEDVRSIRQLAKDLEALYGLIGGNRDAGASDVARLMDMYNGSVGGGNIDQLGRMGRQIQLEGARMTKPERRERPAVKAQKRMLAKRKERRERQSAKREPKTEVGGKYRMVQVRKRDGADRFYIVKRKEKKTEDAEEIFKEWRANLELAATPKRLKKRTRKLSHRCRRKIMLREKETVGGGASYADVVKKHLKAAPGVAAAAEDIFEAWRANLDAGDDDGSLEDAQPTGLDEADIFKVWRHNLKAERVYDRRDEGHPTRQQQDGAEILESSVLWSKELRLEEERHKLVDRLRRPQKVKTLEPEEIFAAWRKTNLGSQNEAVATRGALEPEDTFQDWLNNIVFRQGLIQRDFETEIAVPCQKQDWKKSQRKGNHGKKGNKRRR